MKYKKHIFYWLFPFVLMLVACSREDVVFDSIDSSLTPNNNEEPEVMYGCNLLKNGGLEDWEVVPIGMYDYIIDWLPHNNGNVKMEWVTVCEGKRSAKMKSLKTGSSARVDQCIPVIPGDRIRIRFNYFVEQWKTNGARTYCYFRTKAVESSTIPTDELKAFYSDNDYYVIRGGGYGIKYLPHSTGIWQTFDETIVVPPTANYFVFGVNSYYGTTIYIDDCYVGVEIGPGDYSARDDLANEKQEEFR